MWLDNSSIKPLDIEVIFKEEFPIKEEDTDPTTYRCISVLGSDNQKSANIIGFSSLDIIISSLRIKINVSILNKEDYCFVRYKEHGRHFVDESQSIITEKDIKENRNKSGKCDYEEYFLDSIYIRYIDNWGQYLYDTTLSHLLLLLTEEKILPFKGVDKLTLSFYKNDGESIDEIYRFLKKNKKDFWDYRDLWDYSVYFGAHLRKEFFDKECKIKLKADLI